MKLRNLLGKLVLPVETGDRMLAQFHRTRMNLLGELDQIIDGRRYLGVGAGLVAHLGPYPGQKDSRSSYQVYRTWDGNCFMLIVSWGQKPADLKIKFEPCDPDDALKMIGEKRPELLTEARNMFEPRAVERSELVAA
jgi:hypothetical protein